jgi:hypothetical protein
VQCLHQMDDLFLADNMQHNLFLGDEYTFVKEYWVKYVFSPYILTDF